MDVVGPGAARAAAAGAGSWRGPVEVFLDVDGVLCPLHWDTPDWGWPTPAARAVCDGLRVLWSPDLVDRLRELFDRPGVSPVWLTTWFDLAPARLAPELGWDRARSWPVVARDEFDGEPGGPWWKLTYVQARTETVLAAGGRVLWVDDEAAGPDVVAWAGSQDPDRVLVVAPDRTRGLTPADVDRVAAWLGR